MESPLVELSAMAVKFASRRLILPVVILGDLPITCIISRRVTKMNYVYGLYKKNVTYKTNAIDENLFYIGITSNEKNLYHRNKNHKLDKSNPFKLNIIAKYDFELKILWKTKSNQEAKDREEFLIRWFGKRSDGGILTNILSSTYDLSLCHKPKTFATKQRISKALKKINEQRDVRLANRDRNLTKPYDEIIKLIEDWAKNPLESQQDFANRAGISRSKFKDWIRLYRPQYIGLTKRTQNEIFKSIANKDTRKKQDIIHEYSLKSGLTTNQSKGIVYRLWKNESLKKMALPS